MKTYERSPARTIPSWRASRMIVALWCSAFSCATRCRCCACNDVTRLASCAAWLRAEISARPAFRPIQPTKQYHAEHHEAELAVPADREIGSRWLTGTWARWRLVRARGARRCGRCCDLRAASRTAFLRRPPISFLPQRISHALQGRVPATCSPLGTPCGRDTRRRCRAPLRSAAAGCTWPRVPYARARRS